MILYLIKNQKTVFYRLPDEMFDEIRKANDVTLAERCDTCKLACENHPLVMNPENGKNGFVKLCTKSYLEKFKRFKFPGGFKTLDEALGREPEPKAEPKIESASVPMGSGEIIPGGRFFPNSTIKEEGLKPKVGEKFRSRHILIMGPENRTWHFGEAELEWYRETRTGWWAKIVPGSERV